VRPGDVKAWLVDRLQESAEREFAPERRKLLEQARGRVLEIGAGTGVNVEHYPEGLDEVVLLEPNEAYARRIGKKLDASGRHATVVAGKAEALPFEDASFDTVVLTLVLCTVEDQARSLDEIRRVLRPDGRFLFIEHVRADDPGLARWQDRLNRPWGLVADGCNCNRATLTAIESSQFEVEEVERGRLPKSPPIVRPFVAGRARPRGGQALSA